MTNVEQEWRSKPLRVFRTPDKAAGDAAGQYETLESSARSDESRATGKTLIRSTMARKAKFIIAALPRVLSLRQDISLIYSGENHAAQCLYDSLENAACHFQCRTLQLRQAI